MALAAGKKPRFQHPPVWAVIMAGGSGTRFWPESRKRFPKQFLSLFGRQSLLQETIVRLRGVIPGSRILIITQKDKVAWVRKHVPGIPPSQIIGEPVGRNTAPCAVLAAAWIYKRDPEAILTLLPADHHIENAKKFRSALKIAASIAAQSGMPVTFGIRPSMAHTGYGYLERGKRYARQSGFTIDRLKKFHEKPSKKTAERFYRSKKFLWNSGMFTWQTKAFLDASRRYLPKAHQLAIRMASQPLKQAMRLHFSKMPSISIDYGLMEKMHGKILTIPLEIGWNDLGSWKSLYALLPKDKGGNVVLGQVLNVRSSGNFVKSHDRLAVLLDVRGLVVVDTRDAILVCPTEKTEEIRDVVKALEKSRWRNRL